MPSRDSIIYIKCAVQTGYAMLSSKKDHLSKISYTPWKYSRATETNVCGRSRKIFVRVGEKSQIFDESDGDFSHHSHMPDEKFFFLAAALED